jgi:hypothetical protein
MKPLLKLSILFLLILVILFFIGFFIYASNYEKQHPSPYPNCKRMIKTDTVNVVTEGKLERKEIKSIVYSCSNGEIIQTNESTG